MARKPSDGKAAAEFFEVTVRGDQGSAMLQGKSSGDAVHVGDFVKRLQFASFGAWGRSTGTIWIGRRERLSSVWRARFFAALYPQPVEDLAKIHDRHENISLLQYRCVK